VSPPKPGDEYKPADEQQQTGTTIRLSFANAYKRRS